MGRNRIGEAANTVMETEIIGPSPGQFLIDGLVHDFRRRGKRAGQELQLTKWASTGVNKTMRRKARKPPLPDTEPHQSSPPKLVSRKPRNYLQQLSELKCYKPHVEQERNARRLIRTMPSAIDTRSLMLGDPISQMTRDHFKFQKGPNHRKDKSEVWQDVNGERLMQRVRRDIIRHRAAEITPTDEDLLEEE